MATTQTPDDIEEQFQSTLEDAGASTITVNETGQGDGVVLNRGLAFRHVVALAETFDEIGGPWVGCYEKTTSKHADGGETTAYNIYIVNSEKHDIDEFERLSNV